MNERIRYVRLIVFFDLPIETSSQRRAYSQFRKFLLKSGYLMLQKSVYSKLAIDGKMASALILKLEESKPPEGLIQVLRVTERQFAEMKHIVGTTSEREEVDNLDGLVVL